ncbi:formyltetrahydrofolate deformylase [Laceyella putida]|uniref:Formyltetrahydrofolate deformylase n=1 Tax=Laceyella putida TaxID=110101 RepID=A0ABW2RFS0_9BACL
MNMERDVFSNERDMAILLVSCADRPGIVAGVSQFLFEMGANIVHSDQFSTDAMGGFFAMRVKFQLAHLAERWDELNWQFAAVADSFQMQWRITQASKKKKIAIFVSKEDHCLQELLWRWRLGELQAEIAAVISNHTDFEPLVSALHLPFYHVPVTRETREEQAVTHLKLLQKHEVDTVVLARYMQIIPKMLIDRYPNKIINIHHSFLPAFVGGKPYHQAFERGVKLIGATAHYVTEELDQGPIIEQDVERINHRHDVSDLKRTGRDLERIVLARAVQWHLNDQIVVHGNKTIVF